MDRNARSKELAAELATNLPALAGSEKQTAWAEKIRAEVVTEVARLIALAEESRWEIDAFPKSYETPERVAERIAAADARIADRKGAAQRVLTSTSAKAFIELKTSNWIGDLKSVPEVRDARLTRAGF